MCHNAVTHCLCLTAATMVADSVSLCDCCLAGQLTHCCHRLTAATMVADSVSLCDCCLAGQLTHCCHRLTTATMVADAVSLCDCCCAGLFVVCDYSPQQLNTKDVVTDCALAGISQLNGCRRQPAQCSQCIHDASHS